MALAGCVQSLVDFAIANKQVIIYDSAYAPFIQDPDKPKTIFECEGARQVRRFTFVSSLRKICVEHSSI